MTAVSLQTQWACKPRLSTRYLNTYTKCSVAASCLLAQATLLVQIALHSTDDSKSDEEVVWQDTEWKTVPYREYPWTLSAMQVSCSTHVTVMTVDSAGNYGIAVLRIYIILALLHAQQFMACCCFILDSCSCSCLGLYMRLHCQMKCVLAMVNCDQTKPHNHCCESCTPQKSFAV